MREPVKGIIYTMEYTDGFKIVFKQPLELREGDSLIIDSYYGFGNVFNAYVERKEVKDEKKSNG